MPPLKLEIFKTEAAAADQEAAESAELEELRLASYEQGYSAGWEDSATAQADEQRRLQADLARNLQTLSFTYHEARAHLLRAMAPLMQDMTTHLLPAVMRDAVAGVVLDTLMPLAEELVDAPVVIMLNPAARGAVEALLEKAGGLPVTLREEPSLGEGQVHLHWGQSETRIDLDRATAEITAAVRGFFELDEKERRHG